jgi:hypothetical protein
MRSKSLWALLVAAPLVAAAPAPDGYTIKLKHNPDAGTSVVITDTSKQSGGSKITDANGKVLKEVKNTEEREEVYTETVIEKGDKKPKKYKKTFKTANSTLNGKKTTLPYEGRTVVYELKGDKYEVSVEGTPALDKMTLEELTKKANSADEDTDEFLLPKKPVKAGDTWALDPKAIAKGFQKNGGLELDVDKTKGEAKLVAVKEKDGHPIGTLQFKMSLAVKSAGGLAYDTPAVMEMTVDLTTPIDGSGTEGTMAMTGKMSGKGTVTEMGQKFTVEMDMTMSGKKEQTAEKAAGK